MMGKVIIILALIFFALAGLITYRALQLPARHVHSPEEVSSTASAPAVRREETALPAAAEPVPEKEAVVEELQARIASLEESLARKQAVENGDDSVDSSVPQRAEIVLAVLGAGAFRSGQVEVAEDMVKTVKDLVPEIAAFPDRRVLIEGHTDNIPIRTSGGKLFRDNIELSFLRAKAVADILAESGISSDRLSVVGHGDSRPLASNETPEGRVKNRRVEIKLIPGGGGGR